jgi:hypothetical protein
VCPTCGALLAVAQWNAVLFGLLSLLLTAVLYTLAIVLLEHAVHRKLGSTERFVVQVMFLAAYVAWQVRVVPRFCRLRQPSAQEKAHLVFAGSDGAKPGGAE